VLRAERGPGASGPFDGFPAAAEHTSTRQERHRHNGGVPDLHVVEEQDLAAAESGSAWAGPAVPAGHLVRSGYVSIQDVVIHAPHGHQLLPAEVERAYRRQLELGDEQAWPPPTGFWRNDGRFVLTDGRNRVVACLMLGIEFLLVAWLVPPGE
jgi:hypothetical protein